MQSHTHTHWLMPGCHIFVRPLCADKWYCEELLKMKYSIKLLSDTHKGTSNHALIKKLLFNDSHTLQNTPSNYMLN